MKSIDTLIIGAGSAGLSARKEIAKKTDYYLVVDSGPLGTTCARVGCMPSKSLIEVSKLFHGEKKLADARLLEATSSIHLDQVMKHVRSQRDRFVKGVLNSIEGWVASHFVKARAKILSETTVELDFGDGRKEVIETKSIVIATGSSPFIPKPWLDYRSRMVTTDEFFELEDIPQKVAVIGLGVIGLEIGQALQKLGVDIVGFNQSKVLAGIANPDLQAYTFDKMVQKFPIDISGVKGFEVKNDSTIAVVTHESSYEVDKIIVAAGRSPNTKGLGLENLHGASLDPRGAPLYDKGTFLVKGTDDIYFVGDVTGEKTLLHEAADEGRIAGYNALRPEKQCFKKRTGLGVVFSDPNIASIGLSYSELKEKGTEFETGKVSFEGQGRSITKLSEEGMAFIYGDKESGEILGAELYAPEGEHLAHLLAWAIEAKLSVAEALAMPFYHPVVEEGLRTALRDLNSKLDLPASPLEVLRCQDAPVGCFAKASSPEI